MEKKNGKNRKREFLIYLIRIYLAIVDNSPLNVSFTL